MTEIIQVGLTLSHESYENKELSLAGLKRRSQRGVPPGLKENKPLIEATRQGIANSCWKQSLVNKWGRGEETSVLQLQGKESYQQPISSEKDSEPNW